MLMLYVSWPHRVETVNGKPAVGDLLLDIFKSWDIFARVACLRSSHRPSGSCSKRPQFVLLVDWWNQPLLFHFLHWLHDICWYLVGHSVSFIKATFPERLAATQPEILHFRLSASQLAYMAAPVFLETQIQ